MKREKSSYTRREIAVQINNAEVAARRPRKPGEVAEDRMRTLKDYFHALIAVPMEHIEVEEPPLMTYEELVWTLLAAAEYVQMNKIMGTDRLVGGPVRGEEA